jgi:xanthine dehydrogenase YagS FAD-binding subunit
VKPFAYERPPDVASAVQAAAGVDAMFLAGGTNLVDLMKLGVAQPARLVDLTGLALDGVQELAGGGLLVGATVRNADLAADRAVRERYPVLARALLSGASGQIRNMATVGGNLLQRTRCAYFQDVSKPCNKRAPGSGCPARAGEHQNLAIFGHSPACVATNPSDMAVALVALDARVNVTGAERERTIPIGELHRLPGEHPERDTVLERGELITSVELDAPGPGARSAYRKVRERASFAFALVSAAVVVQAQDGMIENCAIALGGVAHRPWRAARAEELLCGRAASEASFIAAAEAEVAQAQPLRDNAFKVTLARNVIVATLREALEG